MEGNEKAKIVSNLDKLVELTECNSLLLARLLLKNILGAADFDMLISIPVMMARASRFYQILLTRTEAYQHLLSALQETGQFDVLQILQQEEPQPSTSIACREEHTRKVIEKVLKRSRVSGCVEGSVAFRVKAPSEFFTGREQELADLHTAISSITSSTTAIPKIAVVTGLGGIGKTQFARKYIHMYGKYYDNNMIWIDAETAETASQNFKTLASDILGISLQNTGNEPKDISVIINECYQHFQYSKCLFVFDKAEKGDYIEPYLPNNKDWVSVLIVSRECEWWDGVKIIDLKIFQKVKAMEFVRKSLDNENEDLGDTRLLVEACQCLPAALQQAVSYIRNERSMDEYSISDYLRDFESHERAIVSSAVADVLYDDYTKPLLPGGK